MPFKNGYGEARGWMPSPPWMLSHLENQISSASNCTDYQSRRLNIRFQIEPGTQRIHHHLTQN
jgi:seryl-tRNA synthetase